MNRKMIYAEVTVGDDLSPAIIAESWMQGGKYRSCMGPLGKRKPPGSGAPVMLVANTHRVAIRVAELAGRDRRLSPAIKWRLVEENFPIGELFNGDTHVFDGSVFKDGKGRQCFLMMAMPKIIAEAIGAIAEEKWGNVHRLERLDTVEHMLFRQYCHIKAGQTKENPLPYWIVFPQGLGFRILHIYEGLPHGVYSVSDHTELREAELEQAWVAAEPTRVVLMTRARDSEDGAMILPDSGAQWIYDFVQSKGVDVEGRAFCCPACLIGSVVSPKL